MPDDRDTVGVAAEALRIVDRPGHRIGHVVAEVGPADVIIFGCKAIVHRHERPTLLGVVVGLDGGCAGALAAGLPGPSVHPHQDGAAFGTRRCVYVETGEVGVDTIEGRVLELGSFAFDAAACHWFAIPHRTERGRRTKEHERSRRDHSASASKGCHLPMVA